MHRDILWQREDAPGLEHLRLTQTEDGLAAESLLIGSRDGVPYRARYEIHCDAAWRMRQARIKLLADPPQRLDLLADGAGHWMTEAGAPLPALEGAFEVDIFPTPFTNTLPIRRLNLAPGTSAEIMVAYISLPDLAVRPARQRYTCLSHGPDGARYRYDGLESGYTAELAVDGDGLVLDYPEFARMLGV